MLLILSAATTAGREATACDNKATTDADFDRATKALLSLEQVRQWERRVPRDVHVAAIPGDAAVKIDGKCYFEITLYENHPDYMHLWHSFLVGKSGTKIMNLEGDWVPIEDAGNW